MHDTMAAIRTGALMRGQPRARALLAAWMAKLCLATVICLSLLAPGIHISADLPFVRPEQALLPVIFLIYCWLLLAGFARTIRFNGMFFVAAVYCLCVVLSVWYGADVLGHSPALRDFYEIPKALLPLAFFTLAYECDLAESSLRLILRLFSLAILLICFYAWGQFANLNITHRLNEYYSSGEHVDVLLMGIGRVYSTMANPNVLGQLMSWSIPAFTMAVIFRVGNRAFYAVMMLASLATLAMTQSRYGLLTSGIGVALIFGFPSTSHRRRATQWGLLLLLIPIFIWTFNAVTKTNQHAIERLHSLANPLETDSLRGRLDISWPEALSDFARSPVVGNGSAKNYFNGAITDSEFLDVLKQFGIVGFLAYLGFFLYPLIRSWRGLRAARGADPLLEDCLPATFLTARLSIVMIVTALVMNIGESTFFNPLLQGFLWTWMGLGARSAWAISEMSRARVTLQGRIRLGDIELNRGLLSDEGVV